MTGKKKLYYDLHNLSTSEVNDLFIGKYLHIFFFYFTKETTIERNKHKQTNILQSTHYMGNIVGVCVNMNAHNGYSFVIINQRHYGRIVSWVYAALHYFDTVLSSFYKNNFKKPGK